MQVSKYKMYRSSTLQVNEEILGTWICHSLVSGIGEIQIYIHHLGEDCTLLSLSL